MTVHDPDKIVNPAAGDVFYDTAGNAYDSASEFSLGSSTQPTVNDGRFKGARTADITSGLLNGIIPGNKQVQRGMYPVILSNHEVTGIFNTNNIAYQPTGSYIIKKVTATIGGSSNTKFRSGGSDYGIRRAIHQRESVRTTRTAQAIVNNQWHPYSGVWTTDPTAANDISTWETNGTDDVANPTSSKPGELVYHYGSGAQPVQDDYDARYIW